MVYVLTPDKKRHLCSRSIMNVVGSKDSDQSTIRVTGRPKTTNLIHSLIGAVCRLYYLLCFIVIMADQCHYWSDIWPIMLFCALRIHMHNVSSIASLVPRLSSTSKKKCMWKKVWYNLSCESRKDLIVAWAYSLLRMVVPAYTIKRSLAAVPSHTIAAPVREVSVMSNPEG